MAEHPPLLPSLPSLPRSPPRRFSTPTISASDSTIHRETEGHLISMTTRKETIPSRRKSNSNWAPFVPRQRAHMDAWELFYTRTGARQSTGYGRTKLRIAEEKARACVQDARFELENRANRRETTHVLLFCGLSNTPGQRQTSSHSFIHSQFTHLVAVAVPSLHVAVTSHNVSYVHPE